MARRQKDEMKMRGSESNIAKLPPPCDYGALVAAVKTMPDIRYKAFTDGIVINGDAVAVLEHLNAAGVKVNSVITDPPWMPVGMSFSKGLTGGKKRGKMWSNVNLLSMAFSKAFDGFRDIQVVGGASAIFCGDISGAAFARELYERWMRCNLLTWEKQSGYVVSPLKYKPEYIWLLADNYIFVGAEGQTAIQPILKFNRITSGERIHPAQKPEALYEYLLRLLVPEGGIAADFFAGSHVLMRAAKISGRKFLCVESDPVFCKRAVEYIQKAGKERRVL